VLFFAHPASWDTEFGVPLAAVEDDFLNTSTRLSAEAVIEGPKEIKVKKLKPKQKVVFIFSPYFYMHKICMFNHSNL
jgi:hypothetical protein